MKSACVRPANAQQELRSLVSWTVHLLDADDNTISTFARTPALSLTAAPHRQEETTYVICPMQIGQRRQPLLAPIFGRMRQDRVRDLRRDD
jgi:hypothetical protein